jgi:hypothetical protein
MRAIPAIMTGYLVLVQPVSAQTVDAAVPQSVVAAMQDWGMAAKLGATDAGRAVIDSKLNGINFSVHFYSCDDAEANCESVSLEAVFTLNEGFTVDQANAWNSDNRFASAYRRDDGAAVLYYDVNLYGGVSAANFESTLGWWDHTLTAFKEHIDW